MMKFMKTNQLAILVIALMLVTAGYFNYMTNNETDVISTSSNSIIASENIEREDSSNIGDATLVNSNDVIEEQENALVENTDEEAMETNAETIETSNAGQDDYFTKSKLERDQMYSQMIEAYQKILESNTISETQKTIANEEIRTINNTKNAIAIAENLITTKGFANSVIFVNDKSISIVIQATELQQDQIAQIQNIIARELGAEIENIHISNK